VTTQPEPLSLLAFPLTGLLLGDVVTYDLPAEAQRHWDDLLARYRQVTGSNGNLPYSALATALRAATGAHVNLSPRSKDKPPRTLIASAPLSAVDVGDAIRIWEQAILGTARDAISFRYASSLADAISQVPLIVTHLADNLTRPGGQPHAPDWMFDVASWHAAQRIAAQPWPIDDRQVRFRVDTNGDLLVWDNDLLWSHQWRNSPQPRYAAARLRLSMETLPWISDPVLAISPSVLRIANRLSTARNAWLEPNDPHAPLLELGLTGRSGQKDVDWHTRLILDVWTRLRGEQPLIPATADLSGPPGRLRPVIPIGIRYPIGRGLGMHFMRELLVHATEVLGMPPVTVSKVAGHQFHRRPQREGGRDPELLDPYTVGATIAASGTRRLRLVVLYRSSHTRRRIQNLLAHHFAAPALASAQVPDNAETPLAGNAVSVVFCEARELLTHGEHGQRRRLMSQVQALYPPDGIRAVALCETEYDKHDWAVRRFKARYDTTVQDPDKTDAKHVVNKLLADDGVASQFLATKPPEQSGDGPLVSAEDIAAAVKDDHAGHAAVADLLRSAGLVHARLGDALAHGRQGISTPHAYVGLHIREQKKNARRLSITLAALIPDGSQWAAWGYAWHPHPVTRKTGWMRYADAAVAHRASDLIRGSRHTMWDEGIADMINIALDQLASQLHGIPYVLMVPGEGSRTIWPGLANRHLGLQADPAGRVNGKLPLPGPARTPPAAVVRVTPMPGGIRPVPGSGSPKAPKTTNALYEHDQTGGDAVLVLSTVPRQYDGSSGRRGVGSDHSRWTATPAEQPLTWYAHTSTEFLVRTAAGGQAQRYGIATARLCDHAISWDGRTSYPAPLHLARQMDRDHPEYRRTIDLDEEEADVLEDDDLIEVDQRDLGELAGSS
jgi:RNaseH domain of pPIWI_RE/pPIWI_RE module N-terminal domain